MKCPKCNQNAPDTNYKCPACGEILKPDLIPHGSGPGQTTKKIPVSTIAIGIVMLTGLIIFGYLMISHNTPETEGVTARDSNLPAYQPGEPTDIKKMLQPGKTNIFDFYSDYCPPCKKISPLLEKLDQVREDIVVIKIDINREGVRGIDWNSPLARQYNLSRIPHFMVYDPQGNLTHEGSPAWVQVSQLLAEEGISP